MEQFDITLSTYTQKIVQFVFKMEDIQKQINVIGTNL
jgi:hypothetical protein